MPSRDDQELIQACLSGQTEAFGELVSRYQNRLIHTLTSVLGSREDAQDVAQETLVRAFRKLGTFRGDSAFYSWLFRIAINSAITYQRKDRLPRPSLDALRERGGGDPGDPRPDVQPSHSLEIEERQKLVRSALTRLPEEYRTALVLKEMEGLKYEEIADLVGCPVGTVRSRIHRARNELREKLRCLLAAE